MNAETTSRVGIARVRARLSSALCHREASGGTTLRDDSTACSALMVNAAP